MVYAVKPSLATQQFPGGSFQRCDLVLHNIPYDFRIDAEILMNENVAEACYLLPVLLGLL